MNIVIYIIDIFTLIYCGVNYQCWFCIGHGYEYGHCYISDMVVIYRIVMTSYIVLIRGLLLMIGFSP